MAEKTVAVIGAGPSGLCAARHLSNDTGLRFQVFEKDADIGGTWNYSGDSDEEMPVHSSMYRNLRTDIPAETMGFLDFPLVFLPDESSYIHHSRVKQYLKQYADKYQLLQYVEFRKEVQRVSPISEGGGIKWKISVKDMLYKHTEDYIFDAVMVCNGHLSEPHIPPIPGIEDFKGKVLHSHFYRRPEKFQGQKVVIWGSSTSAWDICQDVAAVATNVVVCHRPTPWMPSGFPATIQFRANISSAYDNGLKLEDGTTCEADSLICCTGYTYSFPFLTPECNIEVKDNCVTPLYKHLINIEHPTLCLIGLLQQVVPFIMFDYQVQFFLKILDGTVTLPSKEDMSKEMENELSTKIDQGVPQKYTHRFGDKQWEYFDQLADLAKLQKPQDLVKNLIQDSLNTMWKDIANFKEYKYKLLDNKTFTKCLLVQKLPD